MKFFEIGILLFSTFYMIKDGNCAEISMFTSLQSKNCTEDVVMSCAYTIKTDQLRFTSTKEDLSALCPDLHKSLRCIDNYTRTCLEPQQRSHFNHLYSGTSMVIHEICTEGPLQDEFLRHAPCMNKVRDDYEICASQYQDRINFIKKDLDVGEKEDNVEKICCFLQEYLGCSKNMVKKSCGEETAKFASGFLDKMSNSFIVEHCEKLPLYDVSCSKSSAVNINKLHQNIISLYSLIILSMIVSYSLTS